MLPSHGRSQQFKSAIAHRVYRGVIFLNTKMTLVYWKSERFWLGKLLEHPEIMTQGETLEELEENIKDAYLLMAMDEVPQQYKTKEITI